MTPECTARYIDPKKEWDTDLRKNLGVTTEGMLKTPVRLLEDYFSLHERQSQKNEPDRKKAKVCKNFSSNSASVNSFLKNNAKYRNKNQYKIFVSKNRSQSDEKRSPLKKIRSRTRLSLKCKSCLIKYDSIFQLQKHYQTLHNRFDNYMDAEQRNNNSVITNKISAIEANEENSMMCRNAPYTKTPQQRHNPEDKGNFTIKFNNISKNSLNEKNMKKEENDNSFSNASNCNIGTYSWHVESNCKPMVNEERINVYVANDGFNSSSSCKQVLLVEKLVSLPYRCNKCDLKFKSRDWERPHQINCLDSWFEENSTAVLDELTKNHELCPVVSNNENLCREESKIVDSLDYNSDTAEIQNKTSITENNIIESTCFSMNPSTNFSENIFLDPDIRIFQINRSIEQTCLPVYKCETCEAILANKKSFKKHKRNHSPKKFFCSFCSFSTNWLTSIENHELKKHYYNKFAY